MTAMTLETSAGASPAPRPRRTIGDTTHRTASAPAQVTPLTGASPRHRAIANLEPLLRWDAQLTVEEETWTRPPARERSSFGLRREAELPHLLRREGLVPAAAGAGPTTGSSAGSSAARTSAGAAAVEPADGRRPTALASDREERRQITAISSIVCQATLETLAGVRPAGQLLRWLEPSVWEKVAERAELMRRARGSAPPAPPSRSVRRVRTDQVSDTSWEVCVVLDDGERARACALRLQAHRGRWRVCTLELG